MATLKNLVDVVASVEGVDPERVAAIARAVREAGLIRTRGRGTSAARINAEDASNLIIAVNVAETARTAPETVLRYRALRAGGKIAEFGRILDEILSAATIGGLPDYLLNLGFGPSRNVPNWKSYISEDFDMQIEFKRARPPVVIECRLPSSAMPKFIPFYPIHEGGTARIEGDRRTTISHRTILAVGELLREEEDESAIRRTLRNHG
jgi:hypothetical protein